MEVCTLHIVCIITSPLLKLQVNSHKARVWTLATIRINLVSPNVWFLLWKYHRLLYEMLLRGHVVTIQWYVHHKRSYQWQLSLSSFLAMTTIVVITLSVTIVIVTPPISNRSNTAATSDNCLLVKVPDYVYAVGCGRECGVNSSACKSCITCKIHTLSFCHMCLREVWKHWSTFNSMRSLRL